MGITIEECIDECLDCYKICILTTEYCLSKGGKHAKPKHILLLKDCTEICRAAAGFMLRNSEFSKEICRVCRDICNACAESCAEFTDDVQMQACADVCKRCALACEAFASNGPKA